MNKNMESIFSKDFDYSQLEYLLECDASYDGQFAGLGWVVVDKPIDKVVLEGKEKSRASSTVGSETRAIIEGIEELEKIEGDSLGIIIKTDCSAIIENIKKENTDELTQKMLENLSKFRFWGIECVKRDKNKRAHNLANHALNS
jgi:ribonuclease HI